MKYPNKIKDARISAGLTQSELAERIGIAVQALQNYEYGIRDAKGRVLSAIAKETRTTMTYLLGLEDDERFLAAKAVETVQVPVLGRIAAGTPREALTISDEYHGTPDTLMRNRHRAFWLAVAGNSMNRVFPEGSLVLIDPDATVNNGDIAAVFVNGDDATLKRVYYEGESVRLHPESYDVEYRDRVIDKTDPEAPEVHMVGKAVSYTAPDGWRG
ncbi:MAG: helix-turn-helix domain-containing protein [Atopobium minutum]|uniref:LexA family protein n=1 Tax=Atopobium minutum TaxID=1381 RepID=UPI001DBBE022|nr:LexA family transcriptional regulator [Atopobium minutum]MBS4874127.1 helix-turn-helix domain-containing protein [Atopobium minutum]